MTTYSPKVEIYVNAAWTDISSDVQYQKQITLTRGRDSEGGQGQPSTCTFQLDNRSDNYSPLNAGGAYYGSLGRNTPVRVSLLSARGTRLSLASSTTGVASCPDSAGTSIVGDLDVRADVWLKSWNYNGQVYPVYKQNAYQLSVKDGRLLLIWQQTASTSDVVTVTSTARVPLVTSGRLSIRATLDVDNGASGYTVTFYTSTTAGTAGAWTQLGTAVVATGGITQINDSVGGLSVYGGSFSHVEAFSAAVYSGIAGVLKANPIFTAQANGTTSFADVQGNTWSLNTTGARIDDRDYRFWGEVSELTPTEDASGKDRRADVVAAGPLRRVLAGTTLTESAMDHALKTLANVVAWWPGEDGASATGFASGLDGGNPLAVYGDITFGTNAPNFPGTSSMATLSTSVRFRSYGLPGYTNTGKTQFRFLLEVPTGGFLNDTVMWRFFTTGTAKRWDLLYSTIGTGALYFKVYDDSGLIYTGGVGDLTLIGNAKWVSLEWQEIAGNVQWGISTLKVGDSSGGGLGDTFTSQTFGTITQIYFNWELNDFSDALIGQIVLMNDVTSIFQLYQQVNAYLNESLTTRLRRYVTTELALLTETIGGIGTLTNTFMGFQQQKTIGDLLREIETMDLGIVSDMRTFGPGVQYRTRRSMYGQDASLSLVYVGGNDPYALEMTQDDRATANDVTVTRVGGSNSRVTQDTGALNTQEPVAGIGRYAVQYDLSLGSDSDTYNHAGWRLHLGTVDEPRWTNVEVWGERSQVADIQERLSALELGDRVTVSSVPTRRLPWDIDGIVYGIIETLDQYSWRFKFVTQPERPWHVLEWSTDRRWSPVDSALNASLTSGATSFAVKTNSGSLWTTVDVPFDILIGGERIRVGAVTGSSSPQTFSSCTRAVNGVAKAHSANDPVTLWDPSYWAL